MNPIIETETARLAGVQAAIAEYGADRAGKLKAHDGHLEELKHERLESVDWKEKDELSEKMVEHNVFDPRRRLPPFENGSTPYFGVIGIRDRNPRIGTKEYVLGKQALTHGSKVVIVDWRKAEISRLFYEYEQGEEYQEDIQNQEREGEITCKRSVGIAAGNLVSIDSPEGSFRKGPDGWTGGGGKECASAEAKSAARDHRLVDIVALISAEQFQSITSASSGCIYLTGPAGSGKTTVAIHRLSYMKFNHPELFRSERCLVLVFNRTLKSYVQKTASDLVENTPVETFSTWSIAALRNFGLGRARFTANIAALAGLDHIKKRSELSALLEAHVSSVASPESFTEDLALFYSSLPASLFRTKAEQARFCAYYRDPAAVELQFSDSGVLLRLCQLRCAGREIAGSLNYYDHIIADEAQDFSQLELECIYSSLGPKRSMTICADEKQKILGFVDATGLSNFKDTLLAGKLDRSSFTVGYRSAKEIMELASGIASRVPGGRADGDIVQVVRAADNKAALEELRRVVTGYRAKDPASLTAVICKSRNDIQALHASLSGVDGLHGAGEVAFTPGVVVINAHQVKGLEFTNVVVWNPSTGAYGNSDEDRNLLYVAISRACRRLCIIHWQQLSRWLPSF